MIHFRTSNPIVCSIAWDGNQSRNHPGAWKSGFTPLKGHSATLPGKTASVYQKRDGGFWHFPFWVGGQAHWGIRGHGADFLGQPAFRWEVDDYARGLQDETVNLVWLPNPEP